MPGQLARGRAPLRDTGPNRLHDFSLQRAPARQCTEHNVGTHTDKCSHRASGANGQSPNRRDCRPYPSQVLDGRQGTPQWALNDPRPWSAFSAAQIAHRWPGESPSRPTTSATISHQRNDSCRPTWRLRPASVPVGIQPRSGDKGRQG